MRTVRITAAVGLFSQLAVLAVLAGTVGLSLPGWLAGVVYGVTVNALVARGQIRVATELPPDDRKPVIFGPADRITLIRATLVGAVTALVADSFVRPTPVAVLVSLSAVALVLDGVDGWVARRTRTSSAFGARFDMEVDAFLILALCVYEARQVGGWVLMIGAARYLLIGARLLVPWLRGAAPTRYWRKVVAATQGIVLTVAAADVLTGPVATLALVIALAGLAESFGSEIWWLWQHRKPVGSPGPVLPGGPAAADPVGADAAAPVSGRVRAAAASITTILAVLLLWFALVAPNEVAQLSVGAFLRVPVEALAFVALAMLLPPRGRTVLVVVIGVLLAVVTVVKILDLGFYAALDRPFNPVSDWRYAGPAVGLLGDSIGQAAAIGVAIALAMVLIGVLVLVPLAVRRLTRIARRHRTRSIRIVGMLAVVWILAAMLGLQVAPGASIASANAAGLAYTQVNQVIDGLEDQRTFAGTADQDRFKDTPPGLMLTGLRGKDVIIAFVESYGRVAVQDSTFSPGVNAVLDTGTESLRAAGFDSRSGFLTSPTFGGISWLAHSTLGSGLWIDSQQRYDQLLAGNRLTLSAAFQRAGWRTVGDSPANYRDWPEGQAFYHYDQMYDGRNVGYQGPSFSYANMPDQYVLAALQRQELARTDRPPVMAEVDLVSSHTPWAPLPRMVDWNAIGDGSVFDPMPAEGQSPDVVWRNNDQIKEAYGKSIEYTLGTLISFVQTYGNDDLVLIVLGDHQPATVVTGTDASHDVPVTIIARDPAVLGPIAGWGWNPGLRPGPQDPVWPMDAFRDKFFSAFGR